MLILLMMESTYLVDDIPHMAWIIPGMELTFPYLVSYKISHGGMTVRLSLRSSRSFADLCRSSLETARIKGYFPIPQNFPEKSSSSSDQNMVPPRPLSEIEDIEEDMDYSKKN